MNGWIRPAKPGDAKVVAQLILQAMDRLACKLTGSENPKDALPLFEHFFTRENNQYSYQNTLVIESAKGVAGSVVGYNGADLDLLRKPIFEFIELRYGLKDFTLEAETSEGEFYLDTVSVKTEYMRQGFGTRLIQAACERAKTLGHQKVGLLVEYGNTEAGKLYKRLNFQYAGSRILAGSQYEHLVLDLI